MRNKKDFSLHEFDIHRSSKSKAASGIEPVSFHINQHRIYLPCVLRTKYEWSLSSVTSLYDIAERWALSDTAICTLHNDVKYYKFIPVNSSDNIEREQKKSCLNRRTKWRKKNHHARHMHIMFSKLINFMCCFFGVFDQFFMIFMSFAIVHVLMCSSLLQTYIMG